MPYKEPLGARSVIGRKLLTSLQHSFEGERMLAGEILFRTDKVRSIVQQGDEEGYKVEAKVYTSNRNLCKERHGEYSTWIKVLPYKNTELDNLLQHLMATEVWGDMLNAHLNSTGIGLVLDWKIFSLAPHRIVDALATHLPHDMSERMQAGCNCPDQTFGWCKHIAAVCYFLIVTCESSPSLYLRGIGVDLPLLLKDHKPSPKKNIMREDWPFSPTQPATKKLNRRHTHQRGSTIDDPVQLV